MKIFSTKFVKAALLPALCLQAGTSMAYKVEVHNILTTQAAQRSVLSSNDLWYDWGYSQYGAATELPVETLIPESEITWHGLLDEKVFPEKNGRMKPGQTFAYYRLMAFGADVEDTGLDVTAMLPTQYLIGPTADQLRALFPDGIPARFLSSRAYNHFFNPHTDEKFPLVGIVQDNYTSPTWILEDQGALPDQNRSYSDALGYFFVSFTEQARSAREGYLGKTIHTLGHVVHHIQDMAQPQHTRLDSHCDAPACEMTDNIITGDDDTSVYEVFTRDLIACGVFAFPDRTPEKLKCGEEAFSQWYSAWFTESIHLNRYETVEPSRFVSNLHDFHPRLLWTNGGKSGLADFSSSSFISTDTAYSISGSDCSAGACNTLIDRLAPHGDDLPLPDGALETLNNDGTFTRTYEGDEPLLREIVGDEAGSDFPAAFLNTRLQFVGTTFYDRYKNETVDNNRSATYSIFYERLDNRYQPNIGFIPTLLPRFTMNYFNLEKQAQILMPMAVSYSTGLIDYFFRYRFDVYFDADNSRIAVKNLSEYEFGGELLFYYDDAAGNRMRTSGLVTTPSYSVILSPNQTRYYSVNLDNFPDDGSGQFIAVGKGQSSANQGGYTGIFGKTFTIPRPAEPEACEGPIYLIDNGDSTHTFNLGGSPGAVQAWLRTASPCYANPFKSDDVHIPCPHYSLEVVPSGSSQRLLYLERHSSLTGDISISQSFDFDPQALGTTSVTVRVRADTSEYFSALYLGCPAAGYSASEHDVEFNYRETSAWYTCGGSLYINGAGTFALEEGVLTRVPLEPGMHTFSLTPDCECDDGYNCPINSTIQTSLTISGNSSSVWKTNFEGDGAILVGFDGKIRFVE